MKQKTWILLAASIAAVFLIAMRMGGAEADGTKDALPGSSISKETRA